MAKFTGAKTIQEFGKALIEAGLMTQDGINNTYRIVIDIKADSIPVMYVQSYADSDVMHNLAVMLPSMFDREQEQS